MAIPLAYSAFIAALKGAGLTVIEEKTDGRSPALHNRNSKGPWGPVHGVMIHHTVTKGHDTTVSICRQGHSSLPGPLCHGVICKAGHIHVVGYGRANHAGLGDDDVLKAVIAEQGLPADNETNTDGNRYFYGFECENLGDGRDPWPAVQLDAMARASAALCRKHDWDERSVIGHLEWQPGKIDPRGFTMASMRERVAGLLEGKPKPPAPKPRPVPKKPVVDLSRLVAAAKSNPKATGTPVTYAGVRTVEAALVNAGLLAKTYGDGHYGTTTVAAYAAWQRKLGYSGTAADGIPGMTSLKKLGDKYGFTVVA
ncbi:N-acetylmuramoyl-L-alanine amidase [Streptomyces sp. NPDC059477]|uniref:N-acetylmuramoyl-L-alanine amidase n=1 Tax=Streptomyces sp. NPDC059477 TaxID=3346847 RepID=UPI0036B0BF59